MNWGFLNGSLYGNSYIDWAISIAIIILSMMLAKWVYKCFAWVTQKITSKTKTEVDDQILQRIDAPISLVLVLVGIRIALARLHFPDGVNTMIHRVFTFLWAVNVTWLVVRVVY